MPRKSCWCLVFLCLLIGGATQALLADSGGGSVSYVNQASCSYLAPGALAPTTIASETTSLIDPRGRVVDFNGALLPDYTGFTVSLYVANPDGTTEAQLTQLAQLTPTAAIGTPGTPQGIYPNIANINPFPLSNASSGTYSFLFNPARGQLEKDRKYVLVLTSPAGSSYPERQIEIDILSHTADTVTYSATPLDGLPLNGSAASATAAESKVFTDGAGNKAGAMGLMIAVGKSRSVTFTKTGDHESAEPGDTVGYQITILNAAADPMTSAIVTDTLPIGFSLVKSSVRCRAGKVDVPLTVGTSGRSFTVKLQQEIEPQQTCAISYAATLTPAAVRSDGRNVATLSAMTGSGNTTTTVTAGPADYTVHVRPGLLGDLGTIIGRVFLDGDGDGEQHGKSEIGIGGASILLDDGLEATTDPNGLFSIPNVPSGVHAATLDLMTTPGLTFERAPRFQDNSHVRLVRLEAGGLARLNFALVPSGEKPRSQ